MKRLTARLLAAVLVCLLCITLLTPVTVLAASNKKVIIEMIANGTILSAGEQKSLNVKVNIKSSLSYQSSNSNVVTVNKDKMTAKKPGSVKITVTASPKSKNYKKTSKTITIIVTPQKPATPSGKHNGKTVTVTVKKVKYASGYQFQYATRKNMSDAKTRSTKSISYRFSASTAKTYYVRVRVYTKTAGKTYYGRWSNTCRLPKPPSPSASQKPTACSHIWDSGKITKQPSCVTVGVRTYTCTLCGDIKNENIPTNTDIHPHFQNLNGSAYIDENGIIHDGYIYDWSASPTEPGYPTSSADAVCSIWQCKYCGNYLACGNGIYDILLGDYGNGESLPSPHHSYCDGSHLNAQVMAIYETLECTSCGQLRRGEFVGYRFMSNYVDTGTKTIKHVIEGRTIWLTKEQILEIRKELSFSEEKMPLPANMK